MRVCSSNLISFLILCYDRGCLESMIARVELDGQVVTLGLNGTWLQRNGWRTGRNADTVKRKFTQPLFDHCDTLEAMHHKCLMTVRPVRCVENMVIVEILRLYQELRKESGMTALALGLRHPLS